MTIDGGDFHASAFIVGPQYTTLLIRDLRQREPLWKFPGGKRKRILDIKTGIKRGERPVETVIRETKEETGVPLLEENMRYCASIDKGHYQKHLFFATTDTYDGFEAESDEYEEASRLPILDLNQLLDFHWEYKKYFLLYMVPILRSLAG